MGSESRRSRGFFSARPRKDGPKNLGPTGEFPDGSLGPHDQGALQIGIARDKNGNVVVNFNTEVCWIAMPPEQAIEFAKNIMRHAGAKKIEVEF